MNPGSRRVQWAEPGWATDADRARIPVMNADVILESTERRIILDTKYYKDALARGRPLSIMRAHQHKLSLTYD